MSADMKHIEYCIRLGNTFMQNKLEDIQNQTYSPNYENKEETVKNNTFYNQEDFKTRLRNW